MSESQLQDAVLELAAVFGWLRYHTFDSRRSHRGFPDLVLARHGHLIFAELKAEKGKLSASQREWMDELEAVQLNTGYVRAYVWRPVDWTSGRIEHVLRTS